LYTSGAKDFLRGGSDFSKLGNNVGALSRAVVRTCPASSWVTGKENREKCLRGKEFWGHASVEGGRHLGRS